MKKMPSQLIVTTQPLIEQTSLNNQNKKNTSLLQVLLVLAFGLFAGNSLKAQTVITYLPGSATFNTGTKGYEMTGVGTYFKDAGSSSGNISPNNSVTCEGHNPAFPTSGMAFYFQPVFGNISKITIHATGTGSNRTFSNISTSTIQAGPYTIDAGATATGLISSGTCDSFVIVPSAPIAANLYLKFVITGNLNITSIDFLTGAAPPAATTNAATNVSCTSVTLNGSIDSDGGFPPVTRGFVYSLTNTDPMIGDVASTSVDAGTGTGAFSAAVTSLTQGTTYYVKAWGTNSLGTNYGTVQTVLTAIPGPPTVTTAAATNVTSFGVTTGGDVTADGCSPVIARGVVWGTATGPSLPSTNSTTNGSGTGAFTSQVITLAASTPYFLRAYAINGTDTAYGNEITFNTDVPHPALFASVPELAFPATTIGTSTTLTYTLTGSTLDGSPVTITAPPGFTVSPPTVTYTGTSFTQVVTVTFSPTVIGPASGSIVQAGGGATGIYIISPNLTGSGKLPVPVVTSNVGNDFWLGFGYHSQMKDVNNGQTRAALSLYVSNPSAATSHVVVEMPGLGGGFVTQEQDIAPGGFYEFQGFPLGDGTAANTSNAPDSRLYYTGISNRAIHAYSANGVPFSAWLYDYTTNNSAAGSLIFPTNTWYTSYTVQTIGGGANGSGSPNSFFFVVADQDSTEIEITPTGDILDSVAINTIETATNIRYSASSGAFTVKLNRGQIFNALSPVIGGFGVDLSGSTVKSTNCKTFAVFAGNGRNGIGSDVCPYTDGDGSDNLIQQMFPRVAWGTKYYTVPTKTMEYNTYRITVEDDATNVWLNDSDRITPLTGYNNVNKFYEIYTNKPSVIESDKPISVTQFISSESCGTTTAHDNSYLGNNGKGDPEMIILSPAAQAITKVTVFSPTIKNGNPGGHYINVVIPKDGINSFKLDLATNPSQMVDTGATSYLAASVYLPADALIPIDSAFKPYTTDSSYYWAKFKVTDGAAHTLESVVAFNAIAYGTAQGESYGFNAGTQVSNLKIPLIQENPYGGPKQSYPSETLKTCRGTNTKFSAVLPYQTNKITYSFGSAPVAPNKDTTVSVSTGNLPFDSSFSVNGQTFYVYRLLQNYVYSATGLYSIQITSFDATSADACVGGSDKTISYPIEVVEGVKADFLIDYNSCKNDTVKLTDRSDGVGYTIDEWHWSYNNGATILPDHKDTAQNPVLPNPANNTAANYTVRAINSIGCYADTTKALPVAVIPTVGFAAMDAVCTNSAAFPLTGGSPASGSGGTGVYSGNGVNNGNFNPSTAGAGTHTLTYKFTTDAGCSASATQTIVVSQSSTLSITPVAELCSDDAPVTLVANIPDGQFTGTGVSGNTFNPSVAGAGTFTITYSLPGNNCTDAVTTSITVKQGPCKPCIDPPNVFTPNNDGFYDRWVIINGSCASQVKVDVYNRWGGLVFSDDHYKNQWDGVHKGKALPDGTYYYIIRASLVNGSTSYFKGNVTIMR